MAGVGMTEGEEECVLGRWRHVPLRANPTKPRIEGREETHNATRSGASAVGVPQPARHFQTAWTTQHRNHAIQRDWIQRYSSTPQATKRMRTRRQEPLVPPDIDVTTTSAYESWRASPTSASRARAEAVRHGSLRGPIPCNGLRHFSKAWKSHCAGLSGSAPAYFILGNPEGTEGVVCRAGRGVV